MTKHECPICSARFPCDGVVSDEPTLRDLFAGLAMASAFGTSDKDGFVIADCAYQMADTMLERRKQK